MNARRMACTVAALAAFIVNPALLTGCDRDFAYGEPEMVVLLESVNQQKSFSFTQNGKAYEVSVELVQNKGEDKVSLLGPSVTAVAHACSTRTFLRSASACIDETVMPLSAKVSVRQTDATTPLVSRTDAEGSLSVRSLRLEHASVTVSLGEGEVTLQSPDAKTFVVGHVSIPAAKLFYSAN